jgi:hypothetical protein
MGIATTATAAEEKKQGQRSTCTRNGIGVSKEMQWVGSFDFPTKILT